MAVVPAVVLAGDFLGKQPELIEVVFDGAEPVEAEAEQNAENFMSQGLREVDRAAVLTGEDAELVAHLLDLVGPNPQYLRVLERVLLEACRFFGPEVAMAEHDIPEERQERGSGLPFLTEEVRKDRRRPACLTGRFEFSNSA